MRGTSWYIAVRKRFLFRWTKIPEKSRKTFFSFLDVSFNYFQNALFIAVPITIIVNLFIDFPYWKALICVWFSIPFFEHYYIWLREKWKDEVVK